ncbi:hypothetical protein M422DRAFT_778313 [Sphaerobolus stellatus SS14]|uniref:NmrA-like domain-containing protein n=1 Tax=Sphaerobolus stellatus (strain SS14) TaxID=990650 RepID=A0A0C9VV22_SPHS4|nr:hypothetical protein M422DRAFT_778313 [Sphaerobolus stellatus SS14]
MSNIPKVILITSTGSLCWSLVHNLISLPDGSSTSIRVLHHPGTAKALTVRDEEVVPQFQSPPSISLVPIESYSGATFNAAFRDVSVVIHESPSAYPLEEDIGRAIIDKSKAARVSHFILCSTLHPMRVKIGANQRKIRIEEYLVESRIPYTILQPALSMQSIDLKKVLETGRIPLGFASSIPHGFLDQSDLVSIIRVILENPQLHDLAQYELVGQNISYDAIAALISGLSGRQVTCQVMTVNDYIAEMKSTGKLTSDFEENYISELLVYCNRWGLTGCSNVLRWIMGREPATWETYLQRELQ